MRFRDALEFEIKLLRGGSAATAARFGQARGAIGAMPARRQNAGMAKRLKRAETYLAKRGKRMAKRPKSQPLPNWAKLPRGKGVGARMSEMLGQPGQPYRTVASRLLGEGPDGEARLRATHAELLRRYSKLYTLD